MRNVAGKKRGRSVLSVKVPTVDEEENNTTKECVTQRDIFDAAKPVLTDRFSGAFSSPFYSGRLFDDLGFMGDSECAQQVLEGTYVFPVGIDPSTKMLLEECSKMYLSMSRKEVCIFVTADDYQYYWKRVKERTSSSYCRLHSNTTLLPLTARSSQNFMLPKYLRSLEGESHLHDGESGSQYS